MASVTSKPTADTMSIMPVFSYAQAARGQTVPAQTASQQPEHSGPPSTSSLGKDDNISTTNTIATTTTSSNASDVQDVSKALQESVDLSHPKQPESDISSVVGSVGSNGPAADFRDDSASTAGSNNAQGAEKASGSSISTTPRAGAGDKDASDARKPRKSKKGKNAEKDAEKENSKEEIAKTLEPVKVELSEAPIPAVNIWQQRKEERAAAAAKMGPPAPTNQAPTASRSASNAAPELTKASEVQKPIQASATRDSSEQGSKSGAGAPATHATRGPKKTAEIPRPAGDSTFPRRSAPRGSRIPAKEERAFASESVPPVQDATLWPSIELAAADDSKKKATGTPEKVDQPEKASHEDAAGAISKPRQKKGWVAVPITPTFTYETQFNHPKQPRTRGGGRGGRETSSRGGNSSMTTSMTAVVATASTTTSPPSATTTTATTTGGLPTEKEPVAAAPAITPRAIVTEPRERPREANANNALPGRQASQAPAASKRGSVDSSARDRERDQRKVPAISTSDKFVRECSAASYPAKGESGPRSSRAEFANENQGPVNPRKQSGDRHESRPLELVLDANGSGSNQAGHGGHGGHGGHSSHAGGRPEGGRGGRGGYRGGRGGGHNAGGHHQHQQPGYGASSHRYIGSGSIPPQHHQPAHQPAPFSPTGNHQYQFQPPSHNSGRRGPPTRAQSGPSHGGQRPVNSMGGGPPSRLPSMPLPPTAQQDFAGQAYAQPYAPHVDYSGEYMIIQGLKGQIEYYFSFENLHRDMYLRQRLDSQGFVLLNTICEFRRVRELAPRLDLVQTACAQSTEVDYVTGDDGVERLRSRGKEVPDLILAMGSRAKEAQTDGPSHVFYHNPDRSYPTGAYGPQMYTASPTAFGHEFHPNGGEHAMYPPMYPQAPAPGTNGAHYGHHGGMNGSYVNGHRAPVDSQLSATVPDFSPIANQRPTLTDFQQFHDADIAKLNVILDGSNGSKSTTTVNGVAPAAESLTNGASGHASSPGESAQSMQQMAPDSSKYPDFRSRALEQRKNAAAGETPAHMRNLYKFWIDLLSNTFNVKMYEEFRQLALEDGALHPPKQAGVRYLIAFHENIFHSGRPYPHEFDAHYHEAKQISETWVNMPNGESVA